jgi:ubiquinone/menaquinone biosynthesis C-methylase UbiE
MSSDNISWENDIAIEYQKENRNISWKESKLNYQSSIGILSYSDVAVMWDCEEPLMKEMAATIKGKGEIVLEVGYGLGISAKLIDSDEIVKTHVIIEANEGIYNNLVDYSKTVKNINVIPVLDYFENWVVKQPSDYFDCVFFDTFPIKEFTDDHTIRNFKEIYRIMKVGGTFTFYDHYQAGPKIMKDSLLLYGFSNENIKYYKSSFEDFYVYTITK